MMRTFRSQNKFA